MLIASLKKSSSFDDNRPPILAPSIWKQRRFFKCQHFWLRAHFLHPFFPNQMVSWDSLALSFLEISNRWEWLLALGHEVLIEQHEEEDALHTAFAARWRARPISNVTVSKQGWFATWWWHCWWKNGSKRGTQIKIDGISAELATAEHCCWYFHITLGITYYNRSTEN